MSKGRLAAVVLASLVLVLGALLGVAALNANSQAGQSPTSVPSVHGELRVTSAGDYSSSAAAAGVLERIGAINPDVHFALGDLSYGAAGAEQSWCDLVTSHAGAGFPFELLTGNHESNGQNGNINDFAACLPNQLPGLVGTYGREYYVDIPQHDPVARFVMISPGIPFPDGTWNYSAGSTRYNWTAAAIDGARSASIPWVVVGMHTPCLSMGQYGCVAGADITNLMVSKNVDLVLNGHEHMYQRSKQLSTGSECSGIVPGDYNAACVGDADNTLSKGSGTVFTTVGTGGTAMRDVNTGDPEAPYFAAYSGRNASPSHGLLDLHFTKTTLSGRFIATAGTFQDDFSIGPG